MTKSYLEKTFDSTKIFYVSSVYKKLQRMWIDGQMDGWGDHELFMNHSENKHTNS